MPEKYPKGKHPNSLASLTGEGAGRHRAYEQPKKRREVTVTDIGWEGSQAAARAVGCSGVSEMLEKLGRGELRLTPVEAAGQ